MMQAVAAGWHYKSREQLQELADKVGRRRIAIAHGTEDRMITFEHSRTLYHELSAGRTAGEKEEEKEEVEFAVFEGNGHVIIAERRADVRALIEGVVERTKEMR